VLPPQIQELFTAGAAATYEAALLATARVHYVDAKNAVDLWQTVAMIAPIQSDAANPWDAGQDFDGADRLEKEPRPGARFGPLPAEARRARTYGAWSRSFADFLYRTRALTLLRCPALEITSKVGESRADFLVRARQAAREARDAQVEKLRRSYAPKLARLQEKVRRAEERVRREDAQYDQQKSQSLISVGAGILGAVFGRKLGSAGNVGRATTAARGVSRAVREKGDVEIAVRELERAKAALSETEAAFRARIEALGEGTDPEALAVQEVPVRLRKADTVVERVALVWVA
jgi:hypothetical protein